MREVLDVGAVDFYSACSQSSGSPFIDVVESYSWPCLVKTFVGDPQRRQCSLLSERGHFARRIRDGCDWARIGIHIAEHNAGRCLLWLLRLPEGLIAELSFSNNGSLGLR